MARGCTGRIPSDMIESALVVLTPQQERSVEGTETNPDNDCYDTDIVTAAIAAADRAQQATSDEIVQCEVLLYQEFWTSKAWRDGGNGRITGPRGGEEYIGDWQEEAEQMDRERSSGAA